MHDKINKLARSDLGIFLICFLQVNLVSINTYQIATHKWIGMIIFGFFISFFWTYNVSVVAFSNIRQRIIYGLGGMCGVITGGLGTYYYYILH